MNLSQGWDEAGTIVLEGGVLDVTIGMDESTSKNLDGQLGRREAGLNYLG